MNGAIKHVGSLIDKLQRMDKHILWMALFAMLIVCFGIFGLAILELAKKLTAR